MTFISITRLRIRKLAFLPPFLRETETIVTQLAQSAGFQGGAVLIEGVMVFWTRSAWENEAAMKAFRDTDAHRVSMPNLLDWCDEAAVAHWEGEASNDWPAIHARMVAEGRMSKVRNPSPAQKEKRIPPLRRWLPERAISPLKV